MAPMKAMKAMKGSAMSASSNLCLFISILSHGANESYEGDEGLSHVRIGCMQLSCRDDWPEGEGRQGRRGGLGRSRGRGVEEKWNVQACWRVELEVEEEACDASAQRCESFHQGAMRLQSQASVQDSEGVPHEETEGVDQLRCKLFESVE